MDPSRLRLMNPLRLRLRLRLVETCPERSVFQVVLVWILLLSLGLLTCSTTSLAVEESEAESKAPEIPIPERPYQIRAWVSVDPSARLTPERRAEMIEAWEMLVQRFIGAPWQLEVAEGDGPLLGIDLNTLEAKSIAEAVQPADKGWLIRIDRGVNQAALTLSGREFDATTGQIGPIYQRSAPFPKDAGRSLFQLSQELFTPTAEVERDGDNFRLLVQGAALRPSNEVGQVFREGDIFRPLWIFLDPKDRSVVAIRDVPYTYMRVESRSGGTARCSIVSALARPLPPQVAGRYRLVARGVRAADYPSEFRFVYGQDGDPAAGCVVTVHRYPNGPPREVGTTDRDGRIVLPPRFDNSLMMLRVLAGGLEPLRELPVLPGETMETRTIPVEPRTLTVTLAARLRALQDQLLDLIAQRGRLEAQLEARADGQQWEDVGKLLQEYEKLKPRNLYEEKLADLKSTAERQQSELGIPILTRTARAQLAEVEAMITSYLDDESFQAYAEAYQKFLDEGAPESATAAGPTSTNPLIRPREPEAKPAATAEKAEPKPAPAPPRGGSGPVVPF